MVIHKVSNLAGSIGWPVMIEHDVDESPAAIGLENHVGISCKGLELRRGNWKIHDQIGSHSIDLGLNEVITPNFLVVALPRLFSKLEKLFLFLFFVFGGGWKQLPMLSNSGQNWRGRVDHEAFGWIHWCKNRIFVRSVVVFYCAPLYSLHFQKEPYHVIFWSRPANSPFPCFLSGKFTIFLASFFFSFLVELLSHERYIFMVNFIKELTFFAGDLTRR